VEEALECCGSRLKASPVKERSNHGHRLKKFASIKLKYRIRRPRSSQVPSDHIVRAYKSFFSRVRRNHLPQANTARISKLATSSLLASVQGHEKCK
jgi:hypothetical protein